MKPRQYAALILGKRPQPDEAYLERALVRVPAEWRELVKTHVRLAWEKRIDTASA